MRIPLLLLSILAVAPSMARAQHIFQPGSQPLGADGGLTIPIEASHSCNECHGGYDAMGGDYTPYDSWRGSMMASAARDPIARAAIAVAEADDPDADDFCLRCHTPSAWLDARSSLPEYSTTNPTYPQRLFPDSAPFLSNDLDGIGCMVCHRMAAPSDPTMLSNAELVLEDGSEALVRRGPYQYDAGGVDAGIDTSHRTFDDGFETTSDFCGSCHDISNPRHMGHRGTTATGRPFAIERTYSEWVNSSFGGTARTCQSCHMRSVMGAATDRSPVRADLPTHYLAGGSTWVANAIADAVMDADPDATLRLQASAMRGRAMLQSAAMLEIRASALAGDMATATVRVTNTTGHKLPTGYPEGRRMWLEVTIVDSTNAIVAGSGLYDDATATLGTDAQLRTYQARMGEGTTPSFHFMQVDTLIEDTRIPPDGFRAPDAADIAPLGRDYSDGAGGFHNYDEPSYSFSNLCGTGALTLHARLRYQSNTREYVEFLRDTAPASTDPALAGSSLGRVAYQAWMTHGGATPVDMIETSAVLGPAPRACPMVDAGPADAGTVDASGLDASIDAATPRDVGPPAASPGCGCSAAHRGAALGWTALALWIAARARRRRNT